LHHEVGNPLQAIEMGAANLLEETNPELRRNAYESIRVQVTQLGDLVNQLRRLPDIEDETKALDLEPIDIRTLLEGVVQDAKRRNPRAANRALGLHVRDVRSPLPPVAGDQGLLFIIFRNLIDNAIKYTPNGGRVDMEAYEDDGQVVIQIIDNGRGIPTEDLPYVWEELYRAGNVEGEPGYGMGLALVRAAVDKHRGSWDISSGAGKPGTSVTIRLPGLDSGEQQRAVG
jgi:signal transduction histidine kinase